MHLVRTTTESNTPCKQVQPLSRIKTLNDPRIRGISPVGEEKDYGGKDFAEEPRLKFRKKD